ncbi:MAG TPA: serine/threonine-protein kinase [Steroidobacteraceae bacterium]|nr:serine/threonine-protein kinase [Steroidobacteraceae bacterium]
MNHAATYRGQRGEYVLDEHSPFAFGRASACFRARDSAGKLICLKEFTQPPLSEGGRDGTAEFLAEVEARSRLAHPNILPILDHGAVAHGPRTIPFIAMPLCDRDLRASMRGHAFVPFPSALNTLKQIAAAIDFAHSAGLIHGDIKPENILFVRENAQVYLTDFGTSRFFAYNEPMLSAPASAPLGGTTAYLSPEQIEFNKQTARSDIYSFATVAYEMLVGSLPIDPELPPFRQMQAKVTGKLRDAREINPGLSAKAASWLAAGLALNPIDRPSTAMSLCAGLESDTFYRASDPHRPADVVAGRPAEAKPLAQPGTVGRTWADLVASIVSPRLAIALVGVLLLLVAFAHWQAAPGSKVILFGAELWTKAAAGVKQVDGSSRAPRPVPNAVTQPTALVVPATFRETDCVRPVAPPEPPDGRLSTRETMMAAKSLVVEYNAGVEKYLDCLQTEFDGKVAAHAMTPELSAEVTRIHNLEYNAAVADLQGVADRFNQQLRRFKAKAGGP